ncbi:MAG: class I SAM-dependent methyltransferase [Burkholderiaceae bacterium]
MGFDKEEEIRPKQILSQLIRLCELDAVKAHQIGEFREIDCPACQSCSYEYSFTKNYFTYKKCSECGSLFNSKRMTADSYNDFYLRSESSKFFDEKFYPAVEKARKEKLYPDRARMLSHLFQNDKTVRKVILDVGAGEAFLFDLLAAEFPNNDFRVIEPNSGMALKCRQKGFHVFEGYVHQQQSWQSECDIVLCFEVFEHLLDPSEFLKSLYKFLKPGGTVLITSLCFDGFDFKVLGEFSDMIAPPQHLNFFSLKGYEVFFQKHGFVDIVLTTPGKLDVDIVINKSEDLEGLKNDSLIRFLVDMNGEQRRNFQSYLSQNKMSSHVWIEAKKPEL